MQLSFQDLQSICQALGEFADARSQEVPDKDLILTVINNNGRKTLQTTRISHMTWFGHRINWLGEGDSSLKAVAEFLRSYEPYLPDFHSLKEKKAKMTSLKYHYTKEAVNDLINLEKATWEELRIKKIQGCEAFKRCLSSHNRNHEKQIYILLQENEKIDLSGSTSCGSLTQVEYSFPQPMGIFQKEEDENKLCEIYKFPIIDPSEFLYLSPFFRERLRDVSPKVLGFCYEYGLGVKKNREEAIKNYRIAASPVEYSACYNLARLLIQKGDFKEAVENNDVKEAIDLLKIAEKYLLDIICDTKREFEQGDLCDPEEWEEMKEWRAALKKVYVVLIEAYRLQGNDLLQAEYEQKSKE